IVVFANLLNRGAAGIVLQQRGVFIFCLLYLGFRPPNQACQRSLREGALPTISSSYRCYLCWAALIFFSAACFCGSVRRPAVGFAVRCFGHGTGTSAPPDPVRLNPPARSGTAPAHRKA